MRGLSLSTKLRLALFVIFLAALALAGALLWPLLTDLIESTSGDSLKKSLAVLRPVVGARAGDSPPSIQEWVQELGERTELRITLIRDDGVVVADSERTLEQVAEMENHGRRPEVEEARAKGSGMAVRRSDTLGVKFVYTARPMRGLDGDLYFLRLAQPIAGLSSLRKELATSLAWALSAAILLSTLFAWLAHRELFRPFSQLMTNVQRMLSEESVGPLQIPEEPELASLARLLNLLTDRVDEQIGALEGERSRLQTVLDSLSEGVLVSDATGKTAFVNPRWKELLRTVDDSPGASVIRLTQNTRIDDLLTETLKTGEGGEIELDVHTPKARTLAVTSAALSDGSGAVISARDLSPFLRLAEIRRDLVANASHELKTPLSAIRGLTETLQVSLKDDPEQTDQYLGRILRQCDRLEALLVDLLALSRLEDSQAIRSSESINLVKIIEETLDTMRASIESRRIEIEFDSEGEVRLNGDREALEGLCLNLIDNAVKYNQPGGSVSVKLEQNEQSVVLTIADSGIGIPEKDHHRIFERFYRVDKGRSRSAGGTGLGLAIVKHAVEIHHGRIEIESELGKGSTIYVELPTLDASSSVST